MERQIVRQAGARWIQVFCGPKFATDLGDEGLSLALACSAHGTTLAPPTQA